MKEFGAQSTCLLWVWQFANHGINLTVQVACIAPLVAPQIPVRQLNTGMKGFVAGIAVESGLNFDQLSNDDRCGSITDSKVFVEIALGLILIERGSLLEG